MGDISIFDVASWFLSKQQMTHKKLQKLCYYAYSWFIFLFNESPDSIESRLCKAEFEAWVHGAVNRDLYDTLKGSGMQPIKEMPIKTKDITDQDVLSFLEDVWMAYKHYSAYDLENINHSESPWKNARQNHGPFDICTNTISETDMYSEYAQR